MDTVEVSTVVYVSPEEVFEFLLDFPGYAKYSEYLREVRVEGDGSPGTQYAMTFAWWKLSYTARSEVTAVDRPTRIDWRLVKDLDARGYWGTEPVPEEAPADVETATRVTLSIDFDAGSASKDSLDLPRFVSVGWVVDKVKPLVQDEAERVVSRIVADLEGERRDVDLQVHASPDSV